MAEGTKYPRLSEEDRQAAYAQARELLLTRVQRPERDQYRSAGVSEYPLWLVLTVAVMLIIILLAGAQVSFYRVYRAGYELYLETIPNPSQASRAGYATFLLSEFPVIVGFMAGRIYFRGRERWLMAIPVVFGLLVAFTANWVIIQPHTFWSWLDTVSPPVAVLSVSLILERVILQALRDRAENERAYNAALSAWQTAVREPERHPAFVGILANVLWDAWKKGKSAKVIGQMPIADRRFIVRREMQAEQWFTEDTFQETVETHETAETPETPRNKPETPRGTVPQGEPRETVKRFLETTPGANTMSLRQIEDATGVSYSTVRRVLQEVGTVSSNGNGHGGADA